MHALTENLHQTTHFFHGLTSRQFRGKLPCEPAFSRATAGCGTIMFPQPMSRPEFYPDDLSADPASVLEQHILAGFPPDLALDLVLNELVVRAAEATHATSAALALTRGDEMVCRAATGHLAPDLGVPLNTRDGLSGACLKTRQPQLSVDTEFDPRIDPVVSRRLGIRSILIVPIFEAGGDNSDESQFAGMLEVFSSSPAAFSHNDQKVLEAFAEECARIRQAATEMAHREPIVAPPAKVVIPEIATAEILPAEVEPHRPVEPITAVPAVLPIRRAPYESWSLVLGSLTILAAIAFSFLIGSRIGWLTPPSTAVDRPLSQPLDTSSSTASATKSDAVRPIAAKAPSKHPATAPSTDELVVYEKGKVIFRMRPADAKGESPEHPAAVSKTAPGDANAIVEASSTTKISTAHSVWLSPTQAEERLLSRTEPQYPPEALASHLAGNVVLEVAVNEDGSVSNIRTLSGDPLLAAAAADAVRNWRYQPYRRHDRPSQFQTDVTMSFTLPN